MKYLLIINPKAGNLMKEIKLKKIFSQFSDHELDIKPTYKPSQASRFAYESKCDVVIAAGGDGTVNEVVTGLMKKKLKNPRKKLPRLGIIPVGTANMLAMNLKIPFNVDRAVRRILRDQHRQIDIGQLNQRYFTSAAGVGLDAEFFKNVKPELKRNLGTLAYPISIVQTLLKYRSRKLNICVNGHNHSAYYVLICNFPINFPPIVLARKATPQDGLLDIYIFKKQELFDQMKYMLAVLAESEGTFGDIIYTRAEKTRIRATGSTPVSVHVDAEVVAKTPITVKVHRKAINVIC